VIFRRSLYFVRDIPKGQTITAEDVRSVRPGYGLAPKHLDRVLGRRAKTDIRLNSPVREDLVE
jgi:N-acetylneuraminate synthase